MHVDFVVFLLNLEFFLELDDGSEILISIKLLDPYAIENQKSVCVFIRVFFSRRFTKRVYVSLPNEEVSTGFHDFL